MGPDKIYWFMDVYLRKHLTLTLYRKLPVLLFLHFLISTTVYAQIESTDSLKTDSIKAPVIVNITKSDSFKVMPPVDTFIPATSPVQRQVIPARATLYSFILPGLGQAYNHKYWKIPLIYTGLAASYFFAANNHEKYLEFKDAYKYFEDKEKRPIWLDNTNYTKDIVKQRKDYYKRNRDFNIILGVIFYLMNVLDANVDAHLMNFDISDDLSLNIAPEYNNFITEQKNSNISGFGIKFVLSLNK